MREPPKKCGDRYYMKKSPIKTHPQQSVFNFANQHSYPPAINARVWSCSRLPAQGDHPTGSCFADRLPTWLKPVAPIRKIRSF
jgi:hypothetical protein